MNKENIVKFTETLQEGEKITLVKFNDFGFPFSLQTTVKSAAVKKDNCYNENLEIIHRPKSKRKFFRKSINLNDDFIIWKGWHEVNTEAFTNSQSLYGAISQTTLSCFDNKYLNIALESVKEQPILMNN